MIQLDKLTSNKTVLLRERKRHRPPRSKHTLCCSGGGVPTFPDGGVPTLSGGGLPTFPGGGYLPQAGGTYLPGGIRTLGRGVPTFPSGGVPTLGWGTYQGRYPPRPDLGRQALPHPDLRVGNPYQGRYPPRPDLGRQALPHPDLRVGNLPTTQKVGTPPLDVDRQTPVKTVPSLVLRTRAVISMLHSETGRKSQRFVRTLLCSLIFRY